MNRILRVKLDQFAESPNNHHLGWTLISFDKNSTEYQNLWKKGFLIEEEGEFDRQILFSHEFKTKLENGLAWFLQKEQYGKFLINKNGDLTPEETDKAIRGGLLVWESNVLELPHEDEQERRNSAQLFLDEFNAWNSGEIFCYTIKDQYGTVLDSGGGFSKFEDMLDYLECLRDGDNLQLDKDGVWPFFDEEKFKEKFPNVNLVDRFEFNDPTKDDMLLLLIKKNIDMFLYGGSDLLLSEASDLISERLEHVEFKEQQNG